MATPRPNEGNARGAVSNPIIIQGSADQSQYTPTQHLAQNSGSNTTTTCFPGTPPQWFSHGQPPSPLPWSPPWMPIMPQTSNSQGWASPQPPHMSPMSGPVNSDFMVNSLRRVYNNDSGSIEIERVQVQKRSSLDPRNITYTSQGSDNSSNKSLVPVSSSMLNERRPPPRKNKIRRQIQEMASKTQQSHGTIPQPWYPYMPYMQMYPNVPYPYPSPYYYGYPMCSSGSPPSTDMWHGNELTESDRTSSRQGSLPTTNDSQRIESRTSESFPSGIRDSVSPSHGSHTAESHLTDVMPSDSISLGGYNRDTSSERDILSPSPSQISQTHISEELTESDIAKTREWMGTMHKALLPTTDDKSENGDKSSFTTAPSDIPKAPIRKNKGKSRNKNKLESIGSRDTPINFSESVDETTSESTSNLSVAFKNLRRSVQDFQSQINIESEPSIDNTSQINVNNKLTSNSIIKPDVIRQTKYDEKSVEKQLKFEQTQMVENSNIDEVIKHRSTSLTNSLEKINQEINSVSVNSVIPEQVLRVLGNSKGVEGEDFDGRMSQASTASFHSTRPSTDEQMILIDTDSADTHIATPIEIRQYIDNPSPVVAAAADDLDEDYSWIMQQPGDAPDLIQHSREHERRNAWRAEVSLWRAKLVVSLCRGCGLDRQDWATFQLLVLHPLSLDLKLSILHAPRLCGGNSSVGAGLVRSALLHLTRYGEILLQPEHNRPSGWKSIKVNASQPWAPMKGSVEILRTLGYKPREDGVLRYPRRSSPETSILARLTLDMLVLAEELRLYITGTHQYSSNISRLFFPSTQSVPGSPEPSNQVFQSSSSMTGTPEPIQTFHPNRPSSSASYGFVSAQSSTSIEFRPESKESYYGEELPELPKKVFIGNVEKQNSNQIPIKVKRKGLKRRPAPEPPSSISPEVHEIKYFHEIPTESPSPALITTNSVSPDICSLPDLSTISSSSSSKQSDAGTSVISSSSESVTPVATPEPNEDVSNKLISRTNISEFSNDEQTTKTKTNDNPDEHIYEEITEIRAQVAALRAKEARAAAGLETPPPLPPKGRMYQTGDDSSLSYPEVNWSIGSSLRGGSTGARRKKRRAPLPPEFISSDWHTGLKASSESNIVVSLSSGVISSSHRELSTRKYYDYNIDIESKNETENMKSTSNKSLNPFYEEIDKVIEEVAKISELSDEKVQPKTDDKRNVNLPKEMNKNPFEENVIPSGYIGKNPFYEDIEFGKKSENEPQSSELPLKVNVIEEVNSTDIDISKSEEGNYSEIERLKGQTPRTPPPEPPIPKTPPDSPLLRTPITNVVNNEDNSNTNEPIQEQEVILRHNTIVGSKNVHLEQQLVSRVVVSNEIEGVSNLTNSLIINQTESEISTVTSKENDFSIQENNKGPIIDDTIISNDNNSVLNTIDQLESISSLKENIELSNTSSKDYKLILTKPDRILANLLTDVMNSDIYIPNDDKDEDINSDAEHDAFNDDIDDVISHHLNTNENNISSDKQDNKELNDSLERDNPILEINQINNSSITLSSSNKNENITEIISNNNSNIENNVSITSTTVDSSLNFEETNTTDNRIDFKNQLNNIIKNHLDKKSVDKKSIKPIGLDSNEILEENMDDKNINSIKQNGVLSIKNEIEDSTNNLPGDVPDELKTSDTLVDDDDVVLQLKNLNPTSKFDIINGLDNKNNIKSSLNNSNEEPPINVTQNELFINDNKEEPTNININDNIEEPTHININEEPTIININEGLTTINIQEEPTIINIEENPTIISIEEKSTIVNINENTSTDTNLEKLSMDCNKQQQTFVNDTEDPITNKVKEEITVELNNEGQDEIGSAIIAGDQSVAISNIHHNNQQTENISYIDTTQADSIAIFSDKNESEGTQSLTIDCNNPPSTVKDLNHQFRKSNLKSTPVSVPPMPESLHPLSLFDDIPYIDVNEVRLYQARQQNSKKERSQSPQYDIPEKPDALSLVMTQPITESKLKETALLLKGPPKVPYIDESDIPPESAPPPPPEGSPPETPHTSPPETPHQSPSPSPLFINFPLITESSATSVPIILENHKEEIINQIDYEINTITPDNTNDILQNSQMTDSLTDDRYEIPEPPSEIHKIKMNINQNNSKKQTNEINGIVNKIPETEVFEERYEIPEIARNKNVVNTTLNNKGKHSRSWCVTSLSEPKEALSNIRKSLAEVCPSRPPRGRRLSRPPPRPPKSEESNPPPLPPKGMLSLRIRRKSGTTNCSSSTSTFRSRSVASSPNLESKYSTTISNSSSTRSKSKTRSLQFKRRSKRTRSWPFLLCRCMYVDCYEDLN